MYSPMLLFALSHIMYFALHITAGGSFPKPLSKEEELECLKGVKEGNEAAKNKLIEHNLRLVAHIIKKYYSTYRDQEDLISIGTIGLIKAVSSFDYTKGTKFATYASRCIENEILMHFRNKKKSMHDVYLSDSIDTDKDGNAIALANLIPDPNNEYCKIDYDISFLSGKLSERDMEVFRLSIYGFTAAEIARAFGYTRAWASRIIKDAQALARKKMKG